MSAIRSDQLTSSSDRGGQGTITQILPPDARSISDARARSLTGPPDTAAGLRGQALPCPCRWPRARRPRGVRSISLLSQKLLSTGCRLAAAPSLLVWSGVREDPLSTLNSSELAGIRALVARLAPERPARGGPPSNSPASRELRMLLTPRATETPRGASEAPARRIVGLSDPRGGRPLQLTISSITGVVPGTPRPRAEFKRCSESHRNGTGMRGRIPCG